MNRIKRLTETEARRQQQQLSSICGRGWFNPTQLMKTTFEDNPHLKMLVKGNNEGILAYGIIETPTFFTSQIIINQITGLKLTGTPEIIPLVEQGKRWGEILYVCGDEQSMEQLLNYTFRYFNRSRNNLQGIIIHVPHGQNNRNLIRILLRKGFKKAVPMRSQTQRLNNVTFNRNNHIYVRKQIYFRTECGKKLGNLSKQELKKRVYKCFKKGFGTGYIKGIQASNINA